MNADAKSRILDALAAVTAADLAAVEAEIEAVSAETARKLDSLRAVRALMQKSLGTAPAKAAPREKGPGQARRGGRPPSEETVAHRRTVALMIAREGPIQPAALTTTLGVEPGRLDRLLSHEWFVRTERGYQLTPAGRQANC